MKEIELEQSDAQSASHRSAEMIGLRESPIHCCGVFAAAPIHPGTRIIQYQGEKITIDECERRELLCGERGVTYLFDMENGYAVDGGVGGNMSIYINHSCDPNCRIEIEGDEIWVVASRFISAGEELTYDYWFDPADDETVAVSCQCRGIHCRGTINRPHDEPPRENNVDIAGAARFPRDKEGTSPSQSE